MRIQEKTTAGRSLVLYLMASLSICFGLAACSSGKQPEMPAESKQPQHYELKGKVITVDAAKKELVVDHEAIPDFMAAMTMPYSVKEESALQGVTAGDQITAQLLVDDKGVWIENIVVAGKETPSSPDAAGQ